MAVQAQYPSNVLLLNRNVQDTKNQLGNDYSLQPQPGGGTSRFIDQSDMLFNNIPVGNNSSNPRKRGREVTTNSTTKVQMNQFMSSIHQQQQSNQIIDLTHLHSQPPNAVVSTGLRLSFTDQQQQLQHQQQYSLSPQSSVVLSLLSEDLSSQNKQQHDEIEHFLQSQGEELRRMLAGNRQRYYCALLNAAEETAVRRLRDKEVEVEKAARRNAELESQAAQLSAEAQVWQARALAQETKAATLQAQLQHAIMSSGGACNGEREEAREVEDAESGYIDPERVVVASGPGCKACGKRVASVVLLPCRHLCVCTECDGVVQACPRCLSLRTSSIRSEQIKSKIEKIAPNHKKPSI